MKYFSLFSNDWTRLWNFLQPGFDSDTTDLVTFLKLPLSEATCFFCCLECKKLIIEILEAEIAKAKLLFND